MKAVRCVGVTCRYRPSLSVRVFQETPEKTLTQTYANSFTPSSLTIVEPHTCSHTDTHQ